MHAYHIYTHSHMYVCPFPDFTTIYSHIFSYIVIVFLLLSYILIYGVDYTSLLNNNDGYF